MAFLEPSGPTKKALCLTCPLGGTYDKYRRPPSRMERMHYSLGGAGLGRNSVGCVLLVRRSGWVCSGSSGSRSKSTLTGILEPQEAAPPVLTLLGGSGFVAWRMGCFFIVKWRRGSRHFWSCWACLGYGLHLDPPKKGLVPHSSSCSDVRQIPITSKLPDSTGRTFLTVV